MFPFFLLPCAFYFKLDPIYHFLQIVLPSKTNIIARFITQTIRYSVICWITLEGTCILRSLLLMSCFLLLVYARNIRIIGKGQLCETSIRDFQALALLLTLVRDSMGNLLSVTFGLGYLCVLILQTVRMLGFGVMPMKFYVFFPYGILIIVMLLHIIWKTAVLTHNCSQGLIELWNGKISCVENSFQMKVMKRMVKSVRPITISYGSLGTITNSTRLCYFYSLMQDSVSMILAFKDGFGLTKL